MRPVNDGKKYFAHSQHSQDDDADKNRREKTHPLAQNHKRVSVLGESCAWHYGSSEVIVPSVREVALFNRPNRNRGPELVLFYALTKTFRP